MTMLIAGSIKGKSKKISGVVGKGAYNIWHEYEQKKRALTAMSASDYEHEIRRICRELKI
jgi:hypothetical protein